MSKTEFYSLPVAGIDNETVDAVTVRFSVPAEQQDTFRYQAGQYLTLRFVIDGQDVRRAYSMCSSPVDDTLAVTVKRVKGGLVSNYIADHLATGVEVDVLPPQGRFVVTPDPEQRQDYYLFGAGSGITPLMSMLRTILEQEPKSNVYLLYGNRDESTIIFKEQLDQLEERYRGQLSIVHTLSRPKRQKTGGLASFFTRGRVSWSGRRGRIDIEAIHEFMDNHPSETEQANYFICGPGSMIDTVEQALLGRGIDKKSIHIERFVSAHDVKSSPDKEKNLDGATVTAILDGKEHTVQLKPGQSILDGLLEAGANPPYSCLAGACSTCAAKVLKGGVKMEVCYALDDDEVAEGMILCCQSHPTTAAVKVDFNV